MSEETTSTKAQTQPKVPFEEIAHTADRALRIYGSNMQELLLNAAMGMNTLMVAEFTPSSRQEEKSVELDALDAESLLVEWLSELAFWAETEMLVFHKFDIQNLSSTHVRATMFGTRVPHLDKHIKAVTYHNLEILQTDDGLAATVVFDV